MPLWLSPTRAPRDLFDRLAALRRRMRQAIVLSGSLILVIAVIALLIIVGVIDRWTDLPGILRAVILVGAMVGGILFLLRRVLGPWLTSAGNIELALRVERQFPQFNDSLASAVQFETGAIGSDALQAATRRRAAQALKRPTATSNRSSRPAHSSGFRSRWRRPVPSAWRFLIIVQQVAHGPRPLRPIHLATTHGRPILG